MIINIPSIKGNNLTTKQKRKAWKTQTKQELEALLLGFTAGNVGSSVYLMDAAGGWCYTKT